MTDVVNVHEAKTRLSRLLERAEAGEEIVIARAGKPVARLIPYTADRPMRTFGALRGQIRILPGFDEADEEIARVFEECIARPIDP